MKNTFAHEILLVNTFVVALIISAISNYSISSYVIKGGVSLTLLTLVFYDAKLKNIALKGLTGSRNFTFFVSLLACLVILPAITLVYSVNPAFGLQKLLYLIISTLPILISFYYLVHTRTEQRIKIFFISILISGLISSVYVIINNPFQHLSFYKFSTNNWSHVVFGRFIGTVYFITMLLLLTSKFKTRTILFGLCLIIFGYAIYITGSRTIIIASLFLTMTACAITLAKKISLPFNYIILLCGLSFTFSLIHILPVTDKNQVERIDKIVKTPNDQIQKDGSLQARWHAWEIALEMIKAKPITGMGLGGYNQFWGQDDIAKILKYPHNVLLEFWVEFGIPGLLLFFYLLFVIYKNAYKAGWQFVLFVSFGLILAVVSKDIGCNVMLWMGLAGEAKVTHD